jgi:uroporphyrinogen decarboxylase
MTSYERVKNAIDRKDYDRVPGGFACEPPIMKRLLAYFGFDNEMKILELFEIDKRNVSAKYIGPPLKTFDDGSYETIVSGGPVNKIVQTASGDIESIVHHPWANVEKISDLDGRYGWNGHIDWWDFSEIPTQIDKHLEHGDYWIATHGDPSGLQQLTMWAGDENFLMTLAGDEELAVAMIEKHNMYRLEHATKVLTAGGGKIHELLGGGDYGTQNGLLISVDMFGRYFKPLYKKFYKEIKDNFDVKIFFHSCGGISDIIPDLIEVGVDIIDPVQRSAKGMDIEVLKQKYGKNVTFHGAIDVQQTLPFCTPEQIKAEVRKTIEILDNGGGYILSPTHNIQPDTPIENIIAMYETAQNRKIQRN